jgi:hypothetical protein
MIANTGDSIKSTCEKIVKKYKEDIVRDAFSLISKLLNNILSKPNEDKFRNFKKTNELIKSKILILKETQQLMYEIGYRDLDSEYMVFQGQDLTNIKTAVKIIEDYTKQLNSLIEQQEVKKREEESRKLQEEVDRMKREEILRKQKIQEALELDKKERMQREKAKDSVSKNLEFGAKVCKFEPKRGGG